MAILDMHIQNDLALRLHSLLLRQYMQEKYEDHKYINLNKGFEYTDRQSVMHIKNDLPDVLE